jgi:hypothetical protein
MSGFIKIAEMQTKVECNMSGFHCSVDEVFTLLCCYTVSFTDILGQPINSFFKGQEVQTLEHEIDRLPRNIGKQLPNNAV